MIQNNSASILPENGCAAMTGGATQRCYG